MVSKSVRVGITGGIGSGKSIVSRIFSTLGIPIYDSDGRAKFLMNNASEVIDAVKMLFGEKAYKRGTLNRDWIASQAFHQKDLLEQLNQIVHPAVAKDYENWLAENQEAPYTLKEAALLIETGSYKTLDKLILVAAPEELRVSRVLSRDSHRTEKDVKVIIDNQMSEEEKRKYASFIIENGEKHSVIQQALTIHKQILSEATG